MEQVSCFLLDNVVSARFIRNRKITKGLLIYEYTSTHTYGNIFIVFINHLAIVNLKKLSRSKIFMLRIFKVLKNLF